MCGSYGSQEKGKAPRLKSVPAAPVTRPCTLSSAPSEQDGRPPAPDYSENVQEAKTPAEYVQ